MPFPSDVQRRVAHIDVLSENVFAESILYWNHGFEVEQRWMKVNAASRPMRIGSGDALDLDCDCDVVISAPEGGVVHVNGNLGCDIVAGGRLELVVRGNVLENSTIRVNGFLHIYVRGSLYGQIEATDSSKIWIDGDVSGHIKTGDPSTNLNIAGNYFGGITSKDVDAGMLFLCIEGFASDESMCSLATIGYSVFTASVGSSNVEPGFYPNGSIACQTQFGYSSSRWCVHRQNNRGTDQRGRR
ncbi:hypothetical protein K227x_58610 [Rubripirellula lacrimiformis]|uniref:Polymer-forming cytoskeletal n=1 Tax=Rubripirellula lacrimiformis TaxID=1930273 RepID=A0A517NJX7_9BACT|nr:hypothetical protein [Rubripirellula lacrimiformis]QDT07434.1 hypothetical protein K227x_58610 [Rubripirellula lacrimiformis]